MTGFSCECRPGGANGEWTGRETPCGRCRRRNAIDAVINAAKAWRKHDSETRAFLLDCGTLEDAIDRLEKIDCDDAAMTVEPIPQENR